jgi:SSS family transporter
VFETPLIEHQGHFQWPDYAALAAYLVMLVFIGMRFARRQRITEDYFLGGRRMIWWAVGLSIFSTELSAITFMAIPAKSYSSDWVFLPGNMMIPAIAPLVVFLYLPFFRKIEITTAYEYLEKRFNLAARLVGAAAFIAFQLGRMAIVLFLPALALATVTGVNIHGCILAMGLIATTYTAIGGIEAVIWIDALQTFVLLGGAVLSVFFMAAGVDGGLAGIASTAAAEGKFRLAELSWDATAASLWVMLLGSALTKLVNYTSDQTVVQRYLSTSTRRQAANAIWTGALMAIPSSLLFFFVGTALWAFYRQNPALLADSARIDDIFPYFIARQLPAGVSGLVIAGLFAASMSSLDSSINSMATVVTSDFYRRLRRGASERSCMLLARILTVVFGAVGTASAVCLALLKDASMFERYLAIVGLLGGGLAGMFAAGIFTRRVNAAGVLAGFAASAVVLYIVKTGDIVHFLLFAAVGIACCVAVGWLVGVLAPSGKRTADALTIYGYNRELAE